MQSFIFSPLQGVGGAVKSDFDTFLGLGDLIIFTALPERGLNISNYLLFEVPFRGAV
jgi:hypothetical protein